MQSQDTPSPDAIYRDIVQRLREISVNVDAAHKGIFRGGIEGLPVDEFQFRNPPPTGAPWPPTLEEQFAEIEDLGKLAGRLEDVAIRELARIVWQLGGDYITVREAIEEADAAWLHDCLWERAQEAVRARDLDAWRRDVLGERDVSE
jgi:hypothetical protein